MDEIYELIEAKITASGYANKVSGYDIYNEICDFAEDKDNGTYIFLSKKDNSIVFEYKVDVLPDNFNLSYLSITDGEAQFHINFDDE